MLASVLASNVQLAEEGARAICGPVTFAVNCSSRDAEALSGAPGPVEIHCQVEVQDEQMSLVGFCDSARRDLYRALRQIPGIGRRSALAVLDCGDRLDILRAVAGADQQFFREVPGLGAKRIGSLIEQLERRYHEALPRPLSVSPCAGPSRRVTRWSPAALTSTVPTRPSRKPPSTAPSTLAGCWISRAASPSEPQTALSGRATDLASRPCWTTSTISWTACPSRHVPTCGISARRRSR